MNLVAIQAMLASNPQTLLYISSPQCGVCHSLKPRVVALSEQYAVPVVEIDASQHPEVASCFQVMTVPAVLLFAKGREYHRQARFIRFDELEKQLKSPQQAVDYQQLFAGEA